MKRKGPTQIIVIDDVSRFAVHLWRYLSGIPGFGIGDVPIVGSDGREGPEGERVSPESLDRSRGGKRPELEIFWRTQGKDHKPIPQETPVGDAAVWWVKGLGRTWETQLRQVLEEIRRVYGGSESELFFLVDIRGADRREEIPGGEAPKDRNHSVERYEFRAVVDWLESNAEATLWRENREGAGPGGNILLVSSYWRRVSLRSGQGSPLAPVYSKTGSTFQRIIVEGVLHRGRRDAPRRHPPSGLHLLLTGAGFEVAGSDFGRSLGIPFTWKLMADALKTSPLTSPDREPEKGYPMPAEYDGREAAGALQKAAAEGDLDSYWDELLRLELDRTLSAEPTRRERGKRIALHNEFALREAFRTALVHHDWGHLPQALEAARLPFDAWLTTNYSRFANRAIDLQESHRPSPRSAEEAPNGVPEPPPPWRIIATSNEAKRLRQALIHEDTHLMGGASDPEEGTGLPEGHERRYVFKLHGDIPHVTTMALAGHDKEVSNPLSVPIDSLHDVYSVAEGWVESLVRRTPAEAPVLWHIVGHALWDLPLRRLLHRVCRAHPGKTHTFLLVDLSHSRERTEASEPSWVRLVEALPRRPAPKKAFRVLCVTAKAEKYMAWLGSRGLAPRKKGGRGVRSPLIWLREKGFTGPGGKALEWEPGEAHRESFPAPVAPFEIAWCELP